MILNLEDANNMHRKLIKHYAINHEKYANAQKNKNKSKNDLLDQIFDEISKSEDN